LKYKYTYHCRVVRSGESGVFVGKIDPKKMITSFAGYVDKKASEKKILHDVFEKGDNVFNSG
jgi:solute carrier family 27 fatty acid transporter 1/4